MGTLESRFGAVVRRRRVRLGIGQEDFAHRAGLHRTHVSMIERGLRSPTLAVVQKLATALSTNMSSLMEEVEKEDGDPEETPGDEGTLKPGRRKTQKGEEEEGPARP